MSDGDRSAEQMVRGMPPQASGRANRLMNDPNWSYSPTACEGGADHCWQPVQMTLETSPGWQPDIIEGKVFVVCVVCHSWSYILTEWAGFYVSSPEIDRMEAMLG